MGRGMTFLATERRYTVEKREYLATYNDDVGLKCVNLARI